MTEPAADLVILDPAELALPYAELGEGPHWDIATQSLYWVDIPAQRVHRMDGAGAHRSWEVGLPVGAVVPRASGGLCVAAGNGFYGLDLDTGEVTEIAQAKGLPDTRMNDGKCDRAGRFYAGSMDKDEGPGRGSFYRLDVDGTVTTLFDGVGISNGVGWSPDDQLMYYIDSHAYRVDVMDYDVTTGQMGERRPFVAPLGSGASVPDGLTVDAEGGVWAAVWGGGVIQRYDASGQLSAVVRLPAAHVTSAAFGGQELDQLYITTAAGPGRSAGALFTCPAGVQGLPAHRVPGLAAFDANRGRRVGHDIPMTDNGTAMSNQAEAGESGMSEVVEAAPELPQVPYGAWPSPITAAQVASSRLRIAYPSVVGQTVWWQEDQPGEGGRCTVMRRGAQGAATMLLPAPWNARTRVHEYGGLSYLPVASDVAAATLAAAQISETEPPIVFANFADQRLYLAGRAVAEGSAEPMPLTPVPSSAGVTDLRYADPVLSPDRTEVWCVREQHANGKVSRAIVAVPLDGAAASDPGAVRVLVTGFDFFAHPTPSPDGQWLAWIGWNHPHMPWDGTELRVAPVENGMPGKGRLIKGSNRESVLAPLWRDNSSLYVATDWTGWWNIYQLGLRGELPQALYPADEEFAAALWQLGMRPFGRLGDGRLAVSHGRGGTKIGILDPETSELTDLDLPFDDVSAGSVAASGDVLAFVAGGALVPDSLVRVDCATGAYEVLRAELSELPDQRFLPVPDEAELEGPYGRVVHALIYPPANPDVTGPDGERAPYLVWVHGGPTSHVTARLSLEKAYFTSRGIGIVDVNYGGSTGYGRLYRNRLNREWGIVDVADAKEAARSLARSGHADEARLGIRGRSAGGWTALAAVTTGAVTDPVFTAAVAYYGVSDLRKFGEHTHDFESRYLDGLIGPLPGFDTVYAERAPVGHVNSNTCPVLLLQGLDDPVVPPYQSESIAADLAEHGIRHAYIAFEGESHGFRRADSMIASLEAELSFYGQIFGFTPPGVPPIKLSG